MWWPRPKFRRQWDTWHIAFSCHWLHIVVMVVNEIGAEPDGILYKSDFCWGIPIVPFIIDLHLVRDPQNATVKFDINDSANMSCGPYLDNTSHLQEFVPGISVDKAHLVIDLSHARIEICIKEPSGPLKRRGGPLALLIFALC